MKVLVVGSSRFVGQQIVSVLTAGEIPVICGRAVNCVIGSPSDMIASTRNLASAAMHQGLQRILHFSGIAAFGAATGKVSESAPVLATDWYSKAKINCENHLASVTDVASVILRPALVGGPDPWLWSTRVARMLVSRRLGNLGPRGQGICDIVHVRGRRRGLCRPDARPDLQSCEREPADLERVSHGLCGCARVSESKPMSAARFALEKKLFAPVLRVAEKAGGGTFGRKVTAAHHPRTGAGVFLASEPASVLFRQPRSIWIQS